MNSTDSNPLCLDCGLCCNGVLFADVRLKPADDPARLQSLGLPLRPVSNSKSPAAELRFPQPCAAFEGGRCRVYDGRPAHCRQFECALLRDVNAGRLAAAEAAKTIRAARQRAENVTRLLRELGDADERLPLSRRFKNVKRRLESNLADDETAECFGRLTLAVHDLNVLLSGAFYPGAERAPGP